MKSDILHALETDKVVVVIRGHSKEEAIQTAQAVVAGGLHILEITYTNPAASAIIADLTSTYQQGDVIIGAGTVLDAVTARQAILAGASFIVSPAFDKHVAQLCHQYAIPYLPGCMTITEITRALSYGADWIKLFPGSALGPSFLSAVKSPLPQVSLMVTGGVNVTNAKSWLEAGAKSIGIGGEFNHLAEQGQFQAITALAKEYHQLAQAKV